MSLQWTPALAVGIDLIDAQHREIFRRVERLTQALRRGEGSEAASLVAFLREYVVVHFSEEERLMHEAAYPGYEGHVAEHRSFQAGLRSIDEALRQLGPTPEVLAVLEREAVGWLLDHVSGTDVALGRFVQAQSRPSARPTTA